MKDQKDPNWEIDHIHRMAFDLTKIAKRLPGRRIEIYPFKKLLCQTGTVCDYDIMVLTEKEDRSPAFKKLIKIPLVRDKLELIEFLCMAFGRMSLGSFRENFDEKIREEAIIEALAVYSKLVKIEEEVINRPDPGRAEPTGEISQCPTQDAPWHDGFSPDTTEEPPW